MLSDNPEFKPLVEPLVKEVLLKHILIKGSFINDVTVFWKFYSLSLNLYAA